MKQSIGLLLIGPVLLHMDNWKCLDFYSHMFYWWDYTTQWASFKN